jgi:hypothetical protein
MILIPLSVEKCVYSCWFGATSVPSDLLYSTEFNLYFGSYFASVLREPFLYRILTFPEPKILSIFLAYIVYSKNLSKPVVMFHNKFLSYVKVLIAALPTSRLEYHPFSAVRDCLFNVFTATFLICMPSPPSAPLGRPVPW